MKFHYKMKYHSSGILLFSIICELLWICVQADDIIVVGAGMAGCSAARTLLRNTEHNVIVLEADPDRYGGRMWTTYDVLSDGIGKNEKFL